MSQQDTDADDQEFEDDGSAWSEPEPEIIGADAYPAPDLPAPEGGPVDAEHRFPCHTCGSDLRFDPVGGQLKCDHCGAEETLSPEMSMEEARRELDLDDALANKVQAKDVEETRILRCDSCGAQVEFTGAEHSAECAFCASPLVVDTGTHRHLKPRAVAPFAITEDAARTALGEWLARRWFAPNGLREYAAKGRRMRGVYVPYWTFDAQTASSYRGQRGTVYYVTQTYTSNGKTQTRRVQKIRWRNVSGHVSRFFDDVLVLAASSLPKRYTDALQPWLLDKLQPYDPAWLAGFAAEAYTITLPEGYVEAQQIMQARIREDIRRDIGGDRQRISWVNTHYSEKTFKHVLLPVWSAAYRYRDKSYRFVVNGQTGKVQGERPWSVIKIAAAVTVVVAVAVAAWLIFGNGG